MIFSQWSDVLYVFEQAFNANGIKYATLQKNGVTRFKDDPTVRNSLFVFKFHPQNHC